MSHRQCLLCVMLSVTLLAVLALVSSAASAQPKKPAVPPGAPPRGFAVALLSGGIDYTRPAVAAKLARDGEGDIIGWDAVDGDARPFARDSAATRLVEIAPTLIAPFRLIVTAPEQWSRTLTMLARTPARVVVVAASPSEIGAATRAEAHMGTVADVLFILPADVHGPKPDMPGNVILVAALAAPGAHSAPADILLGPAAATREAPLGSALPSTSQEAAILLPGVFACVDVRAARSPAEVKRSLLAKAAAGPPGAPPLLGLCR